MASTTFVNGVTLTDASWFNDVNSITYNTTGSGNTVLATSPTLVTPVLGAATATSINKVAITAPATSATITVADGKTLTASNSITLAGTDSTTMTFPSTNATIARTDSAQTFTGVQSMTSPAITTSITTPSTTFALVNTTATTVNAFGAATTLNIGNSGGTNTVLGVSNFSQGMNGTLGSGTPAALAATTGAFSGAVTVTRSANDGSTSISAVNANAGTAASASFAATSSAASLTGYMIGGNFTTAGRYIQASGLLETAGAGGLNFSSSHASGSYGWYINGDNKYMSLTSTGLAVTGTASVTKATAGDVITFTNAAASNKTGYLYSDASLIGLMNIAGAGAGEGILIGNSGHVYTNIGGVTKLDVTSSGLAVTGVFTSSGTAALNGATIGNAAARVKVTSTTGTGRGFGIESDNNTTLLFDLYSDQDAGVRWPHLKMTSSTGTTRVDLDTDNQAYAFTGALSVTKTLTAATGADTAKALYVEGYPSGLETALFYRDNTDSQPVIVIRSDQATGSTYGTFIRVKDQANSTVGSIKASGVGTGDIILDGVTLSTLAVNGSPIARASSTGLAVTGTGSVTTGFAVGGATPQTGGVAFPATAVAVANANTLDDYEEGTWTIGVSFGGGTTGITSSTAQGTYTKFGDTVSVSGYIILTSKGSSTGSVLITGLPFTISNNSDSYFAASTWLTNVTFTGQTQSVALRNSTTGGLYQITEAGTRSDLTDANFANNSQVIFTCTYRV